MIASCLSELMRNWIDLQTHNIPPEVYEAISGHPLVAQTLMRRGIKETEAAQAFLNPDRYTPTPPGELPGIEKAASRLQQAIKEGRTICVWGDFDVDGQTATTLLVSSMRDLGANIVYHIPVRASESHGVNPPVLRQILGQGIEVVLTCDTGITAHEAARLAQNRGVDFIVTDHHDLPPTLPAAYAIVNPKLLSEEHPLATLPGVGVAYKLAEELYRRAGRASECERHLDLVALGIVADLAIQRGETRYLLQRGLDTLRATSRLGLQVMLELVELEPTWLTEEHIGYILGPRLNALGRLSDANSAVEFLTTHDLGRARILAHELEGLNARRKYLTDQVFKGALAQLESDPALAEQAAIVLAHPAWPAGVIGIVASRMVERFHKPAVLIATPTEEPARGSARSVEGINITAAIAAQQELLLDFGGHPMAAGLAIEPERIPDFRLALSKTVKALRKDLPDEIPLQIDGYLQLAELSLEVVEDLERLAPFGAGNPPLVLVSQEVEVTSKTIVGRGEEHLLATVTDIYGNSQRVIWWQGADETTPEGKFDLAYTVRSSTFGGQRDIQVEWVDGQPVEGQVEIAAQPTQVEIVDYRNELSPDTLLRQIRSEIDLLVWREGKARDQVVGSQRDELIPARTLAIWTTPPGPAELLHALDTVLPEKVVLFTEDPEMDRPEQFLHQLAGLVKFTLKKQAGHARLTTLAGATAQREKTVKLGLAWLEAYGHIKIDRQAGDEIFISAGDRLQKPNANQIAEQLRAVLDETAAYRSYFKRADKDILLSRDPPNSSIH